MTIRSFLDCSTGHLTQGTREWLHARGEATEAAVLDCKSFTRWVATTPYGWFVYADEENDIDDIPADLFTIMQYARKQGAEYILFDCDAEEIADLVWFEEVSG